jgi:hypothetical protein
MTTPPAFPVRQQGDRIRPKALELANAHLLAGGRRMDAVPKEQFSPIDVAHPGNDALIHEQFPDRTTGRPNGSDESGWV